MFSKALDIAFMGDFRQLPAVGVEPIYVRRRPEFCDFINCYIELKGQYRFKQDPEYGELCHRFHIGCPTQEDFATINSRIVSDDNPLPNNIRVGCKYNSEREAINASTWLQHLHDHGENQGLVILADNVRVRRVNAPDNTLTELKIFYTDVGEDDCDTHMEGKFTPMIRCYPKCPMMMTKNKDVGNNQANGRQGLCVGVVLKEGKTTHDRNIDGMIVRCIYASELKHLLWEVNGKVIEIEPKEYTSLKAKFPIDDTLSPNPNQKATIFLAATQIPLVSNNATTGHKLQGSSIDVLYIPSWSYSTNWPYVLISRVRTLEGLYIGRPLDPSKDYSVPDSLSRMLRMFRRHKPPSDFDYSTLQI